MTNQCANESLGTDRFLETHTHFADAATSGAMSGSHIAIARRTSHRDDEVRVDHERMRPDRVNVDTQRLMSTECTATYLCARRIHVVLRTSEPRGAPPTRGPD